MAALSIPFKPLGWLRRAKPEPPRLLFPAYRHDNPLRRHRKKLAIALFFFTLIYVMAFQLIGRFIVAQFVLPLVVLFLLVIWALPERGRPPIWPLTFLLFAFACALVVWPDYLAVALPGLPWITASRLTGVPLTLILLITLSISQDLRGDIHAMMHDLQPFSWIVLALLAIITVSIGYSESPGQSLNQAQLFYVNAIGPMVAACLVFARPGYAMKLVYFLWGAAVIVCLIAAWEARLGHVPWYEHVPSFLAIEDEAALKMMAPDIRKATGLIRMQSTFKNPLNLAEFLALMAPFLIHFVMTHKKVVVRAAAAVTLPLTFWVIIKTDSRLGAGGFMISFILYALWWGTMRWRGDRRSIFGPAVVLSFPALFAIFIGLTFTVGRLENMVWGTGAQTASNMSREMQWDLGIPKIIARPWGYGWGAGSGELGFRAQDELLTVDSYYLTLLMDIGVVGFALFIGLFALMAVRALFAVSSARTPEQRLMLPLGIACAVFLLTKSVLSDAENHPLMFILLGMGFALLQSIGQKTDAPTFGSRRPQNCFF